MAAGACGVTALPEPFYDRDGVTIYHGRCEDVLPHVNPASVGLLLTDPPYPNNAGWFDGDVLAARGSLASVAVDQAVVFWSELDRPTVGALPLVAVHVWHRTNVNGRPYEPLYHFAADGEKRRSNVWAHPAVFYGAGPGCREYVGHPTQKPIALMRRIVEGYTQPGDLVLDPYMGSGPIAQACYELGRRYIGVECVQEHCEVAVKRLGQQVLPLGVPA